MKKIATKLITISGQILLVSLFLIVLFSSEVSDKKTIEVSNDNFVKMADSVSYLFKQEEAITNVDESIVTPLTESIKDEIAEEDNNLSEDVQEDVKPKEDNNVQNSNETSLDYTILETVVGNLTGYGPDCSGCSGITSSGHNLLNSVYYNDSEFGNVRILAADPSFPFYSIFRVTIPGRESFLAIALDRGGNVGYGKGTLFDLAFATENDPNIIGLTPNVSFELLRRGH